jgi:2-oxoglutarate dehydrogenase E2 component (dihydrolipoamide succinyltransferase)
MMNYTSKFFSSVGNTLSREVRKSCAWQFYSTLAQSVEERIVVPQMGDSITEGTLEKFLKFPGDKIQVDEVVALIETDKVTLDVRSTNSGQIRELKVSEGESVVVGQEIMSYVPCLVDDIVKKPRPESNADDDDHVNISVVVPTMGDSVSEGVIAALSSKPGKHVKKDELIAQIETDKVTIDVRSPDDGLFVKYTVQEGEAVCAGDMIAQILPKSGISEVQIKGEVSSESSSSISVPSTSTLKSSQSESRGESRVKMSRLRMRVSERLKSAQNTYAMLTTFNEIDMTNVINMRKRYKDQFQAKYGDKLGFMSTFVAASARALREEKNVNAVIENDEIVFKNFVDISVAVSSPKGLVVPVLRSADKMTFAQIEFEISRYAKKANDGTLSIDEMTGGTFTISNGGTFGSLSGTPIINPPQSAILGMHSIVHRPICIGPQNLIVARPMMNVALTYDHRLIDGREAVSFLRIIKKNVEDPLRMLTEL